VLDWVTVLPASSVALAVEVTVPDSLSTTRSPVATVLPVTSSVIFMVVRVSQVFSVVTSVRVRLSGSWRTTVVVPPSTVTR
jgi:hypothetical protein